MDKAERNIQEAAKLVLNKLAKYETAMNGDFVELGMVSNTKLAHISVAIQELKPFLRDLLSRHFNYRPEPRRASSSAVDIGTSATPSSRRLRADPDVVNRKRAALDEIADFFEELDIGINALSLGGMKTEAALKP